MNRLALIAATLASLFACADDPCGEYVDYMCECHADDPDVDCGELERTLSSDDPDVLDQCAIDLADQREKDDEAGLTCDVSEDTTFSL